LSGFSWMCFSSVLKAKILPLAIVLLLISTSAYAGEVEGEASAIDGDSLNTQIRIFGIDTPEPGQICKDAQAREYACGQVASDALTRLVRDKIISCKVKTRDRYGRPVAICYADDVDLGGVIVNQGLAVAFRRYSDKYVAHEQRARAAKRGLWAGTFELPWEYREHRRKQSEAQRMLPPGCPREPNPLSDGCIIKGNVSRTRRIYHMPGIGAMDKIAERAGLRRGSDGTWCDPSRSVAA